MVILFTLQIQFAKKKKKSCAFNQYFAIFFQVEVSINQ